ncbi:hypothetical protein SY27_11975 [Flavobacterium sp. 316]|uniref:ATP-binding response regulator n=1 Tax=Flavobacterium sp. 316 TaxID=1603293 RepID=UPI0005E1DB8A|nr:hybrid sensor histidine kinase/response regulator [Flavobacterium sp. 316]KIX20616.1 hypothetical protein SY27_11975 [Flavobacterium sp. 316]
MAAISKYTSFKLLLSYLLLLGLMAFSVWYLFQQQSKLNRLLKTDTIDENQLAYTELIRDIYQTDNLSRIALQTKTKKNIVSFLKENEKIILKLDTLKTSVLKNELTIVDSLKRYLRDKEYNVLKLLDLQNKRSVSVPINQVVKKIENIESIKGKLKIESLFKNAKNLTPYQRKVAQEYVDYLNSNVPKDDTNTISHEEADSILTASKIILLESQKRRSQESIAIKSTEVELLKNELVITQKLSDIILKLRETSAIAQEKVKKVKIENQENSLRLLSIAAIICLILVVFFFILLSTDFLKNKKYRQELELQKQKTEILLESREQLMASVSHDIKTPLQSLIGYSAQLLEKENLFENREKLLKIKSATHYIEQLVLDLLDYVRMEKGKIKVLFQEFELNELLEETGQNIADLHQKETVDLKFEIDETEDLVYYGDYNKIRQILYNLISNAYKFTQNGSITIITKIEDNRLLIAIKDTGIGIASNAFEKIFDSFTQENSEIELLYGGTGLGLSICKRLSNLLEGTIHLESELGEGSTFTVNLPYREKIKENLKEDIVLTSCLILDDDMSQIQLTKSLLQPYFEKIYTFSDGHEALAFCEEELPTFVLTDIHMPKMSGYSFLTQLRKIPFAQNIKVIVLSGQLPYEEAIESSFSFDTFLAKPFTPNQLLNAISTLSGKKIVKIVENGDSYNAILKAYLGDNEEDIRFFIKNYIKELTSDIASLEEAIKNNDANKITSVCHKMQTMVGQLDKKELLSLLNLMEEKHKEENTNSQNQLESDFQLLLTKLNQFKESLTLVYTD